jgi:PIN domain nuclease of toxin-antitoxin system
MTVTVKDNSDLLSFLVTQAESRKDWFGFVQQRITAVALAHDIARYHADKMTPEQVASYALELNEVIYHKIIKTTR